MSVLLVESRIRSSDLYRGWKNCFELGLSYVKTILLRCQSALKRLSYVESLKIMTNTLVISSKLSRFYMKVNKIYTTST